MNSKSPVNSKVNKPALVFAAVTLILLLPPSLEAQTRRTLPENVPVEKDPDKRNRAQEIEVERARRDPQVIMAEVNEDFGRLNAIDEQLKLVIKSPPADYKKIADSSAEIKKRATRLKANLIFLFTTKEEKRPKNSDPDDELNPLLKAMDSVLESFLRNPIFKDVGEIDPQLANRARYDLEDMIKLSDKLKKAAEKQGRTPAR
jgi:hypothetical protein